MVLKTSGDLGEVTISNNVISEIAGAVATKCYGVVGMASRNKKDGIVNLLKPDSMTKGISITVEEGGVIVVNRVRYTIENTVGIKVNRINVRVEGVRVD